MKYLVTIFSFCILFGYAQTQRIPIYADSDIQNIDSLSQVIDNSETEESFLVDSLLPNTEKIQKIISASRKNENDLTKFSLKANLDEHDKYITTISLYLYSNILIKSSVFYGCDSNGCFGQIHYFKGDTIPLSIYHGGVRPDIGDYYGLFELAEKLKNLSFENWIAPAHKLHE
ncbi:MAG: hypothetical protein ABI207_07665 [Crocinitomicaceae bacterium]